jgi:predicted ABC-type ATPase
MIVAGPNGAGKSTLIRDYNNAMIFDNAHERAKLVLATEMWIITQKPSEPSPWLRHLISPSL